MNITGYEKEFRRKMEAQGFDFSTAKTYCNCICLFMKFIEPTHTCPLRVTTIDMENYIINLRKQKYSASYINQFIASAKLFYKLNGQPNKCDKLVYHIREQKTPNVLTYKECMLMCNSKLYIKHKAIINLLYYGALRRSELLNLKILDVSPDSKINILDSKFCKSRVIPIPQETLNLLRCYYLECKPKEYVFNGDKNHLQYSAKSVENIIKDTAKKCGISKRVYPHIMRSSRATHLLDHGASDMYVSTFLGHAQLQTTKDYYCKLTIKGMQDNFEQVDRRLKCG